MIDDRFFKNNGPFKISDILLLTSSGCESEKADSVQIRGMAKLSGATQNDISFLENPKYLNELARTKAGACFISEKYAEKAPENCVCIINSEPYRACALLAQKFYTDRNEYEESVQSQKYPGAYIAKSAKIADSAKIMPGVFIGANVEIGENSYISANTTITHSIIGDNVIIHRGCHIGGDGFGFAMGKTHEKVPQLGNVIIEDNVEIGCGTCIDRGSMDSTFIGQGSKIDNLVQIGHNARIGRNVVIVAQVGIAGSTEIGDYSILGGQAGIAGHIKLGKNVQVAACSGVPSDVEDGKIIGGYPAIAVRDWHRQTAILKKLVKEKKHV